MQRSTQLPFALQLCISLPPSFAWSSFCFAFLLLSLSLLSPCPLPLFPVRCSLLLFSSCWPRSSSCSLALLAGLLLLACRLARLLPACLLPAPSCLLACLLLAHLCGLAPCSVLAVLVFARTLARSSRFFYDCSCWLSLACLLFLIFLLL